MWIEKLCFREVTLMQKAGFLNFGNSLFYERATNVWLKGLNSTS